MTRPIPPDFKKEFLTKYLGYPSELRGDHYKASPLPHFEFLPYDEWLNTLAAGGHSMPSYFGYACLPFEDPARYHSWTMFFLRASQGGLIDGSGILVRYETNAPITGRFAICQHKMVPTGTREQSMRGWNPGYCEHCGFDLSVDSSD